MDALELARKHGMVEEEGVDKNASLILGLRKYCEKHPDNEIAKRWLAELIDKSNRVDTLKGEPN